jgi:hypothetical protein
LGGIDKRQIVHGKHTLPLNCGTWTNQRHGFRIAIQFRRHIVRNPVNATAAFLQASGRNPPEQFLAVNAHLSSLFCCDEAIVGNGMVIYVFKVRHGRNDTKIALEMASSNLYFVEMIPHLSTKWLSSTQANCHLTFVTTYGLRRNANSAMVQSEVTMDDLFR